MKSSNLHKLAKPLLISVVFLLTACFSLPNENSSSNDLMQNNKLDRKDGSPELSKNERMRNKALLAGKSSRPSLKNLDLQPITVDEMPIPSLSLAEKRDQYELLLPLVQDPVQKQQVAFRLADIKMLIAEQEQAQGSDLSATKASYEDAITDYKKVLLVHQIVAPEKGLSLTNEQRALNRKQMDAMYQLTRALDLSAKPEQSMHMAKQFLAMFSTETFNITPYHIELYFRIGEYYFNRQQYRKSISYYSQVVEYGNGSAQVSTNFYSISAYMLGWSYFKIDDYSLAMQGFAKMLDANLVANSAIAGNDLAKESIDRLAITKGEKRLVNDALRIMALTFSYQGNGAAIQAFFEEFGKRDYEHLIYNELAQQHLDNDRFQDSANVLATFANANPMHPRAVEFFVRQIDAYILGGFSNRVLAAKENFVKTYSLGNSVLTSIDTPLGRAALPYLRDYIKQLAQTEHSIAQSIDSLLHERLARAPVRNNVKTQPNLLVANSKSGFAASAVSHDQNNAWALASNSDLQQLSQQAYRKAKAHYINFIGTFSPSPEVTPLRFYLAEALLALNEYEAAIEAFETFAYSDVVEKSNDDLPKIVEAAYAALLVYQQMEEQNPQRVVTLRGEAFDAPLSEHQTSQAKFVNTFMRDKRAPVVALTLMQNLFTQENYKPAQIWAKWLLHNASNEISASFINISMQESAMLVMAHSHFAMEDFSEAETAYRELLAPLALKDDRRKALTDRLAASLFKQAENLLRASKLNTASLQAQNISNRNQLTSIQLSTLERGVVLLQKVVVDTPFSEFRLAAQYDSAVYSLLLENWSQAIAGFIDFQQRYPTHLLSQNINNQLFYAYQQTQDWAKAAPILFAKYEASPTTDGGRMALLQAAEYYEKANNREKSLSSYRTYAHEYPMPLEQANEARFNLSEFYAQSNEHAKRRFWLNKMVQAQLEILKNNPNLSTPRSVYLASMSSMVFAQDADTAFSKIKLTQPLAKSLHKKQAALNKAIKEYESVITLGSADYVSDANYRLANLYTTLGQDLMNSSRPSGLSALELSQYEMLLEEQAYPFEETAIGLHEKNIARVRVGLYDEGVKSSYIALRNTNPGRYNKPEVTAKVSINDF